MRERGRESSNIVRISIHFSLANTLTTASSKQPLEDLRLWTPGLRSLDSLPSIIRSNEQPAPARTQWHNRLSRERGQWHCVRVGEVVSCDCLPPPPLPALAVTQSCPVVQYSLQQKGQCVEQSSGPLLYTFNPSDRLTFMLIALCFPNALFVCISLCACVCVCVLVCVSVHYAVTASHPSSGHFEFRVTPSVAQQLILITEQGADMKTVACKLLYCS